MKGIAAWIWIISSVVLGLLVIVIGSTLLMNQYDLTQKQLAVDEFSDFYNKVKTLCAEGGIGEIYYYKISIPENVRAIYVANASDKLPPDTVSQLITKSRSSIGNYLLLQFFDDTLPKSGQLDCYVNFTYIGNPSLQPTLQSLVSRLSGKSPVYNFLIFVMKTDYKLLFINATETIGLQNPTVFTPTITTAQPTTSTTGFPSGGV